MDIIKLITGNNSIKNMLINKAVEMGKENGFSRVLIDLNENPVKIEAVTKTSVIIEADTLKFLKDFFEANKHLINK